MDALWNVILAFICGAGGLAIINIIQERWKWKQERKAKKEDRAEDRTDQLSQISSKLDEYVKKQEEFNQQAERRFTDMEKKDKNQTTALKYVLLDRIRYIGQSYIKHGTVTFDERRILREMHDCYHNGLGGNGDADDIMSEVGRLPLKTDPKKQEGVA
jgi:5'-3' exonuclease